MPGEPPKKSANSKLFQYSSCKLISLLLIHELNYGSANTIDFVNVHILNGKADRRGVMVKK
jgi:hypothetical protein